MCSNCTIVELHQEWKFSDGTYKQDNTGSLRYRRPTCAIYIRSINLVSELQRLRLSVHARATTMLRTLPCAGKCLQAANLVSIGRAWPLQGWGKNCSCHQLGVSKRPGSSSDNLPESSRPSPAPSESFQEEPAWFRASWSRRKRCPPHPQQNVPMNTYAYCSAQSLRMVRRPTLYSGLYWEDAKLNNVLIKSRAEWWEERREGARGMCCTKRTGSKHAEMLKCNYFSSFCFLTVVMAFSHVGNNNTTLTNLTAWIWKLSIAQRRSAVHCKCQ